MPSDEPHGIDVTELGRFSELATRRRSSLLFDRERPVPDELVRRLCKLATWAPNHRKTWPWRFTILRGDARLRLGELTAERLVEEGIEDEAKLAKARAKFTRAPVVLIVAAAPDDDPELHEENRYAVAAAVQTLLLGATAAGLASFWASGAPLRSEAVREYCGFDEGDHLIALVYLGWPAGDVEVPLRPEPVVNTRES